MWTGRWTSTLAIAVLLVDALLLLGLGLAGRKPLLLGLAGLLGLVALGIVYLVRRQQDRLDQVAAARRAVRDEARVLAELSRRAKSPE